MWTTSASAATKAPPCYRVVEEPRSELVTAGAVFIGISVVSLGYAAYKMNNPGPKTPEPANDGFGSGSSSSAGPSTAAYAFGLWALSGVLGTTLLTIGLSSKRQVLIPTGEARVSIVPTFGGLAVTGAF